MILVVPERLCSADRLSHIVALGRRIAGKSRFLRWVLPIEAIRLVDQARCPVPDRTTRLEVAAPLPCCSEAQHLIEDLLGECRRLLETKPHSGHEYRILAETAALLGIGDVACWAREMQVRIPLKYLGRQVRPYVQEVYPHVYFVYTLAALQERHPSITDELVARQAQCYLRMRPLIAEGRYEEAFQNIKREDWGDDPYIDECLIAWKRPELVIEQPDRFQEVAPRITAAIELSRRGEWNTVTRLCSAAKNMEEYCFRHRVELALGLGGRMPAEHYPIC